MKKLISILMVIILVFTLSACSDNNSNKMSNTETGINETINDETKDNKDETDNTHENVTTESAKNDADKTTHENDKTTNESKPSDKENTQNTVHSNTNASDKYTDGKNNKNETTDKKQNGNAQNTEKHESDETKQDVDTTQNNVDNKPYYVGYELVKIDRPITTYKVNGIPLIEKAYGTKYVLQVGDTAVFKIKMSDNGTTGFDLEYSGGCQAEIEGNLLKITATGGREKTDVYIRVDTQDGQKNIQIDEFIINAGNHNLITTSSSMTELFEIYAMKKGLSCAMEGHYAFSGFFTKIENEVHIKIPNNPNWIEEVFDSIDAWVGAGYKKFTLQVVIQSGYTGSGGY